MLRTAFLFLALSCGLPGVANAAALSPQPSLDARHLGLLKEHCAECHNEKKQKGKFRVDTLPSRITSAQDADRWQKVLAQLNSGEMPPEGEKQLPDQPKTDLLEDLSNAMVTARKTLADRHGAIPMRRLNRREYANTLRELLGVHANVSKLPADTGSGHFDTAGASLFMSQNQFEQYRSVSREALDEAFELQAAAPFAGTFRFDAKSTFPKIKEETELAQSRKEAATRWAAAVDAAAARPENTAITAKIRAAEQTDARFRARWDEIPGAPSPKEFIEKFPVGVSLPVDLAIVADRWRSAYELPYYEYYVKQPKADQGAYLATWMQGLNSTLSFAVPHGWPPGEYRVRVRVGATEHATPERRFLEFGTNVRNGAVLSTYEITGTMEAPQTLEIPLHLSRNQSTTTDGQVWVRERNRGFGSPPFGNAVARHVYGVARGKNGYGPEFALWVEWMEIERVPQSENSQPPALAALAIPHGLAPLTPQGRRPPRGDELPITLTPQELRAALERFATVAFRGVPPTSAYVDRLEAYYQNARSEGESHTAALKDTLSIVLASPMFLYLAEPNPGPAPKDLSGPELASRLSYLLWSAPPDATLQQLGQNGDLLKAATLHEQTERLLNDQRANDFLKPFLDQWLSLDRLDFFEFNTLLHPKFDASVKLAARNEIYESFAYLLQHNGSLRHLLKADYVLANKVLADFYDLPDVHGDHFQKISLPPGSPRGGLLGMAAVLAMGGNGEKSNPVERGAWVLRKLLTSPPPPAPANVPQLARLAGKLLTTRERSQAHQEFPQCASCHRKIDPIGFGLENFDAAGRWRTEDTFQVLDDKGKPVPNAKKTWKIDPSGTLHKGPAFADYFELRDHIASQTQPFARGFAAALLEYGLGRACGFSDEPLLDDILHHAESRDFGMREFIHALVSSQAFHRK
jgi:mono/diheme cytochrome c family protein